MHWLPYLAAAISPVSSAAGGSETVGSADLLQLITSALNLGLAGVVFWLFVGGKLHASSEMDRVTADRDRLANEKAEAVADAVASARADLLKELQRVLAEKAETERELAGSRRFATDQLIPLLGNFTAATGSLLPVLQELIHDRERHDRDREDRRELPERRPRR